MKRMISKLLLRCGLRNLDTLDYMEMSISDKRLRPHGNLYFLEPIKGSEPPEYRKILIEKGQRA